MNGSPTLGLWCTNLNTPLSSLDEWLDEVDQRLATCRGAGSELLVLPELTTMRWLQVAPELSVSDQPRWLAERAAEMSPRLQERVDHHDVALVAGSTPFRVDGDHLVNRCCLFRPGAEPRRHDKLELTPSERGPEGWCLTRGDDVSVHRLGDYRVALLVCLDVELTEVIARLGDLDVDLVVVVAGTRDDAGYHRVFDCAKARAVELQCPVAVVGLVGETAQEPYVGGAAVYLPCEPELGDSGVAAAAGPFSPQGTTEPWILVPDVPIGTCREIRHEGAEVSRKPARWAADHLRVVRASEPGGPVEGSAPGPKPLPKQPLD